MNEDSRDPWASVRLRLEAREARVRRAIETGDDSELRSSRDRALYAVELARVGQWERAHQVIGSIGDLEERNQTLVELVRVYMKQDADLAAVELLASIPDDTEQPDALLEKVDVLSKIAKKMAKIDHDLALRLTEDGLKSLELLKLISAPWVEPHYLLTFGWVLWDLSKQEAGIGLWDRASSEALQSDDIDCKKLLGEIALAFIEGGQIRRAEELLPGITFEPSRARVLEALGKTKLERICLPPRRLQVLVGRWPGSTDYCCHS
jgi:hypothetical protein